MDGPVLPALAIFSGSVDRIDDPDPRFVETLQCVPAFLGEKTVIGTLMAQGMDQKLVRGLVARLPQCFTVEHVTLAHLHQYPPCRIG